MNMQNTSADGETNLLIVEDKEEYAEFLEEYSGHFENQYNADITIVNNYDEFQEFKDSKEFEEIDVVVTDLMMPYGEDTSEENAEQWKDFVEQVKEDFGYENLNAWGRNNPEHGTRGQDTKRMEKLLNRNLTQEDFDDFGEQLGYLGGSEYMYRDIEGDLDEYAEEVRSSMVETAPYGVSVLEEVEETDKESIVATDTHTHSERGSLALAYIAEEHEEEQGDVIHPVNKDPLFEEDLIEETKEIIKKAVEEA